MSTQLVSHPDDSGRRIEEAADALGGAWSAPAPVAAPAGEDLTEVALRLDAASPQEILRWAVERFHPRLALATAFGAEGCVLVHMVAEIEPRVFLFNLDTGYQFPEALATRDRLMERYGVHIELVRPDTTVEEMERAHGGPLHQRDPVRCCYLRKVAPLQRALRGFDAWVTAIRADQTADRASAAVVEWDHRFGLVKLNPLLRWAREEVWRYIFRHQIPYNPLHDRGYPSIGCWPCTRQVQAGEHERAGRWAGNGRTECGVHVRGQDPARDNT